MVVRKAYHCRKSAARVAAEADRMARFLAVWRKHRRVQLVAIELDLPTRTVSDLKREALAAGLLASEAYDDLYLVARARGKSATAGLVKPMAGKLLLDDENHELVHEDGRREPAPPGLVFKYDMRRVPGTTPPAYELTPRARELRRA